MACDCRDGFEQKARDRFTARFGDLVDGEVEARMENHVYLFSQAADSEDAYRIAIPVVVRGQVFNKRSPGSHTERMQINAIATFCPFCGRKLASHGEGA